MLFLNPFPLFISLPSLRSRSFQFRHPHTMDLRQLTGHIMQRPLIAYAAAAAVSLPPTATNPVYTY